MTQQLAPDNWPADERRGVALFERSHERLLQQFLEMERQRLASDVIDHQLMSLAEQIIQEHGTSAVMNGETQLSEEECQEFRAHVRGLTGGGSLVPLLEREDVENIHILGHDNVILSLADGRRIPAAPLAHSEEELVMMIRHLAATAGHTSRRFDTASPILDLRLASGHRLFAITAVAERTSVVIRRHRMLQSSLEMLERAGTVTRQMIPVLQAAVHQPNPCNMLVVGGTGAGKTTLLRSLLTEVPQHELVVTIEDTLELHLGSSGLHERTLALETRTSNTEGTGEISMYDLCKAALRMSPDRVIVGEVRGGEVMQLLQSMGIGNDGSIGTIHAGSTRAAINKILIYAQRSPDAPTPDSVMREISEVLHLLIYIKKLPSGRRAITSIREITGFADGKVQTSEVFAPGPDGIAVYTTPFDPHGEPLARLRASGFDPASLGEPYRPQAEPAVYLTPPAQAAAPRQAPPPHAAPTAPAAYTQQSPHPAQAVLPAEFRPHPDYARQQAIAAVPNGAPPPQPPPHGTALRPQLAPVPDLRPSGAADEPDIPRIPPANGHRNASSAGRN